MGRRIAAALAVLLALGFARPARADDAPAPPQIVYAKIPARPALWTVRGPKGTAYLFGSIHILPPQVDWHAKDIDAALAKADVLVFELAMDATFQERVRGYIQARGMLPPGQHLRDMLSPAARGEFDSEVAALPVSPAVLDRMRPWLAALTIETTGIAKQHYAPQSGVEMQLQNGETKDSRPVIGLETIEQQLALLAPDDPKIELQAFEASLTDSQARSRQEVGPLLDAWMHGDVRKLGRLTDAALAKYPQARKLLFDDRNQAWVKQIALLLDQDKVYFITVGAGHLVGPRGVPALLRAKGFRVEGP